MIELIKVILAIFCAAIPFFVGQRFGLLRYASPMHIVAYLAFLGFTVKAIVFSLAPELAFFSSFTVSEEDIGWGYFYLTSFIIAMTAGYVIFSSKRPRVSIKNVSDFSDRIRSPAWILFLGIASAVITTYFYFALRDLGEIDAENSLDTLRQLNAGKVVAIQGRIDTNNSFAAIRIFYVIPVACFALLLFKHLGNKNRSYLSYIFTLISVIIIVAIVKGTRRDLLDAALITLAVFSLASTKIIKRAVITGILSTPVILVVFSFMSNLRDKDVSLIQDDLISLESLQPIVTSTYFLDINLPTLIQAYVRDDQMLNGESYVSWTFAWIPRAFWPDKPAIDPGIYIKQQVFGIKNPGGFNATAAGEAFLNFGWFGIIVGFMLGFGLRKIEEFLLSDYMLSKNIGALYYVVPFSLGTQTVLQSSFSGAVVSAAAQMAVIWILCRFTIRPPQTGSQRKRRGANALPGKADLRSI